MTKVVELKRPDRTDWIAFLAWAHRAKTIASQEMHAYTLEQGQDVDWPNHHVYSTVQGYGLVFVSAWGEFEPRIRDILGALPADEYESYTDDPAHYTKAAAVIEQLERGDRFVTRSTSGMTIKPSEDPNAEQVFPPEGRTVLDPSVLDRPWGAYIMNIDEVRPHGDNLSIVKVGDHEVVANRREDGSFRWMVGEPCVYVPEGALIPDDVLQDRGYWDEAKGKGLLEGKKGNRVKMRRFAGFESRGLLFKVGHPGLDWTGEMTPGAIGWLDRGDENLDVFMGDNVTEFFGITQHQGG